MSKEKPETDKNHNENLEADSVNTLLDSLLHGDFQAFIQLAENSIHPGIMLVKLAQKAQKQPSPGSPAPTKQEITLLATNFPPQTRFVEVACHIAADQELLERFMKIAEPIQEAAEKRAITNEADLIRIMTAAKARNSSEN